MRIDTVFTVGDQVIPGLSRIREDGINVLNVYSGHKNRPHSRSYSMFYAFQIPKSLPQLEKMQIQVKLNSYLSSQRHRFLAQILNFYLPCDLNKFIKFSKPQFQSLVKAI